MHFQSEFGRICLVIATRPVLESFCGFPQGLLCAEEVGLSPELPFLSAADEFAQHLRGISCILDIWILNVISIYNQYFIILLE